MKSNRWYFVLGAVAVTALAIVAGAVISLIPTATTVAVEPVVAYTPAQASDAARSITVVGTGSVSIAPDRATATIGVDTQAASPDEATRQNDERVAAVIEALKAAGIEPADIQTAYYNLYAEQRFDPGTGQPTGEFTYRVSTGLSVTVRDLPRLGSLLNDAVKAGANNISGVSLSVADQAAFEASAREKAIADAKARAQALAELSGVTLGEVVSVSEVIGGVAPVFDRGLGGGGAPIQPGAIEVRMQVQVSFAIGQ
ncbi:MAG TPA: SIMPL domain-containing protein [Anaerolineae bacterium]|nr:SIMPL domain-containing protein [Anaerolineae bacterium]